MRSNPWFALSALLAVLGVVFYLAMGLMHGGWTDVGVYSVTVVLVGFGVFGALTARGEQAAA